MKFREQAERFGAEFVTADADRVDLSPAARSACGSASAEYRARSIIISTGATARMLGLPSEQRLLGHGVSTCATCDGFFFREQPIAVVGGGDSAIEEAIFLTKFATEGHAHPPARRAARRRRSCRTARSPTRRSSSGGTRVVDDVRRRRLSSRRCACATPSPAPSRELPVSGLFVAIGHDPNTELFEGQLELDENGYIVTARRLHAHLGRGRVRRRRRAGPRLPPGDHRRRHRLHGRDRGRALARRARARAS